MLSESLTRFLLEITKENNNYPKAKDFKDGMIYALKLVLEMEE